MAAQVWGRMPRHWLSHCEVVPLPNLNPSDPVAQVLYDIASGTPATVVNAPPGGGKTRCIASVAAHTVQRLRLPLVVATPTRNQAAGIATRLLNVLPPERVKLEVAKLRADDLDPRWHGVNYVGQATPRVVIKTLDSLRMTGDRESERLLVIDEGYQASFALGACAARSFDQIVVVGDPGQIGPVITVDTSWWDGLRSAPHLPFASVLAARDDVSERRLPHTYRLGRVTTDLIAPLYPFAFDSARPDTWLAGRQGRLPEISAQCCDPDDVMQLATQRVTELLDTTLRGEGVKPRRLEPKDVAVVTALRAQATVATAWLAEQGLDEVQVGTADLLQGGEWPAVVAVDPLVGGVVSDHHASMGRLCVMLSRHKAHLSFLHDAAWEEVLDSEPGLDPDGHHRRIRTALCR